MATHVSPSQVRNRARWTAWSLLALTTLLMGARVWLLRQDLRVVVPELRYFVDVSLAVEGDGVPVDVKMALPIEDDRQTIRSESFTSGEARISIDRRGENRFVRFSHSALKGSLELGYTFSASTEQVRYELDPALEIDLAQHLPLSVQRFLLPEKLIQSDAPEVREKLAKIVAPGERRVKAILTALFHATHEGITPLPLRGTTDALTALALSEASCGGKSRLFVALARAAGIPARVVGGIILNEGGKRSSHLWAEAWVRGHWIPYCPLNGYEALVPAQYLLLYKGDEPLFERSRDIRFRHFFRIKERLATPEEALDTLHKNPWSIFDLASTFRQAHISLELLKMILMLPFGALVVAFFRNILGVPTFGAFMPALIALGFRETGLGWGLGLLASVIGVAYLVRRLLHPLRLLQIPKLVVLLTTVIAWMLILGDVGLHFGWPQVAAINLFPIVILSMTAERFFNQTEERGTLYALITMAYTAAAIAACYGVMGAFALQTLVLAFPEMLLVPVALAIWIGSAAGLRVAEMFRFRRLLPRNAVGINRRNMDLIFAENKKALFPLVNDKLLTKEKLQEFGVPCPPTLAIFEHLGDANGLAAVLDKHPEAALKPASGRGGGGILILRGRTEDGRYKTSQGVMDIEELRQHLAQILLGVFSLGGGQDRAFLERLLINHPDLDPFQLTGVADVRVILHQGNPVMAMLRLPTSASKGKANLHAGALGVGVDMKTGKTTRGWYRNEPIFQHPDSGASLVGFQLPHFQRVLELARESHQAVPMGYMGVDIVLDAILGPVIIELNGRPGLEIQNANGVTLSDALAGSLQP